MFFQKRLAVSKIMCTFAEKKQHNYVLRKKAIGDFRLPQA